MRSRIFAAGLLLFGSSAFAQTYIVPNHECGAVTFQLTRGDAFPDLGEAIGIDRVARTQVNLQKQRVVVKPAAGPSTAEFSATIAENAIVIATAELEPTVAGNETRTEQAKALVRCGTIVRDGGWRLSAGLRLEIFPQWNEGFPLKPGHEMRFIVVDNTKKGELVRAVRLELYRADGGLLGSAESDQGGMVTFPETEPGRYLVTATYRRPDPKQPEHWLVDTTSLTFDVK